MNENIQEFLYNWLGIIILFLAISLFLMIYLRTIDMNNHVYKSYNSDRVLYENVYKIKDKKVTGAEIIYQIYKGLVCDIQVDNVLIQKEIDTFEFDYLTINPDKKFSVENKIDSSGKIMKIIYY